MDHRVSDLKRPDKKTLIRMRRWVWVFLILSIVSSIAYGLSGLRALYSPDAPYEIAQKKSRDPMHAIRTVRINSIVLYIPIPYFTSRIPSELDQRDVSVSVLYPDFKNPITERPQKLWEEGQWYRNIRILFGDPSGRKSMEEMHEHFVRNLKANHFMGVFHGLELFAESDSGKTMGLLFIIKNSDKITSFIECNDNNLPNPQCSHWIWDEHFTYKIAYDKDILPHWREIRDKSLDLVESFRINSAVTK